MLFTHRSWNPGLLRGSNTAQVKKAQKTYWTTDISKEYINNKPYATMGDEP